MTFWVAGSKEPLPEEEAPYQGVFFADDGTNLEYAVKGSGPKLLLIHGFQNVYNEVKTAKDILSRYFTVYFLYRRGWGLSGSKGPGYSMETECADVALLMERAGIDLVFGYGFGGLVGLHTCLRRPARRMVFARPCRPSSLRPDKWADKVRSEREKGHYADALAAYAGATDSFGRKLPASLLRHAISESVADDRAMADAEARQLFGKANLFDWDVETIEMAEHFQLVDNAPEEIGAALAAAAEYERLSTVDTPVLLYEMPTGFTFDSGKEAAYFASLNPRFKTYKTPYGREPSSDQIIEIFDGLAAFLRGQ